MAQWLGVLAFFAEALGSVLSTHVAAYSLQPCNSSSRGSSALFQHLWGLHACGTHAVKNTYTYKINFKESELADLDFFLLLLVLFNFFSYFFFDNILLCRPWQA